MMERWEIDYREIILHGYKHERNTLKLFFIDESVIWKNEGISKARFFQNLHDAAKGMFSILEALNETAMMDNEIYPIAGNIAFDFIAGNEMATLGMPDLDMIIAAIDDATISISKSVDRPGYLEIALLLYYKGVDVTNEAKATEIAKSYGYDAKYSGKGLKQVCDDHNQPRKIVAIGSKRYTNDKIKLLEKIIDLLPNYLKSKAETDLNTLKENAKKPNY